MRYTYTVAYQLMGITSPTISDATIAVDFTKPAAKAKLTSNIDSIPLVVDQAAIVGHQMLGTLIGQAEDGTPDERVARGVTKAREQRASDVGANAILLFEAEGSVDDFEISPQREIDDFVIAICESPKKEIRARYESEINGIHAAIAIASPHFCGVKKLVDQIIFFRGDSKPIFCYSFSGSGRGYASTNIPDGNLATLPKHARALSKHQSLTDVARLITRSLAEEGDPLLSFLSAWSGLEIFVNKNFRQYEELVLGRLGAGEQPAAPPRLIERIRVVMSDKYRLADKFSVIANELGDLEVDTDQASFEIVKNIRNRLLHGEDIALRDLPTSEALRLLRKYVGFHLQRAAV